MMRALVFKRGIAVPDGVPCLEEARSLGVTKANMKLNNTMRC